MTIEITEILNTDITSGQINGEGTFDLLMTAFNEHISAQFDKNRITKTDYANIYLGATQAAMAQAVQFQLQRQQTAAQAQLLIKQGELVDIEKEKVELEKQLVSKQIQRMNEEILQIRQQVSLSKAEEINVTATLDRIKAETANVVQTGVNLVSSNNKLISEKSLVDAQTALTAQNKINLVSANSKILSDKLLSDAERDRVVADTANIIQNKTNLISTNTKILSEKESIDAATQLALQNKINAVTANENLILSQDKIKGEARLLNFKAATELAQTRDDVYSVSSDGIMTSGTVHVTGVVGKQKDLYNAQKNGFSRDAEQKILKILTDTWSVRNSADPEGNSANSVNKLFDDTIGSLVDKAVNGVNS